MPERPRRPALIELSAAILIVSGVSSVALTVVAELGGSGTGVTGLLILALNVLMIVVGVTIRRGAGWVLAVNVVAIALFIELTALPSAFAVLFVLLDGIVLFSLFRHRDWFYWRPPVDPEPA